MWLMRFLLRFIMIPLGGVTAALTATLLVLAVTGHRLFGTMADPEAAVDAFATVLLIGPTLFLTAASASFATVLPALLAVAVAEIAAIRSWLYYAAAGGLAAFVGWWSASAAYRDAATFNDPSLLAAAGIAGGLGYWAVAGWNAGFWKPVFASGQTQQPAGAPPAA